MLVLSRKPGESIMIGDQIELIILGTEGDVVKIGVIAPKQQQILRKEIYVDLKESNQEASNPIANLQGLRNFIKKSNILNKKIINAINFWKMKYDI